MLRDTNTIIESLGVYLPPNSFSTSEILEQCDNKFRFPLEKISGIKSRRMAGIEEFSLDLAKKAIIDCLANSKYNPNDIDLIVCCNISRFDGPDMVSFEPCTAIKLRKYFKFENAIAFDITNACAGMFTGVHIVNSLLKTNTIKRALVVSGEYITHLTKTAQREIKSFMDNRLACLTLGDAGAALILERTSDTKLGFQELDLQTIGRHSTLCTAQASEYGGWIMHTDSVKLTDVAIKNGSKHSLEILKRADWPAETFDHLILHQTSKMTLNSAKKEINHLLKKTVLDDSNTINNLEQRGNTASTSHFVALYDQIYNNKINSGDRLIFGIIASGLTLGTALYVLDDLPSRMQQKDIHNDYITNKSITQNNNLSEPVLYQRVRIESIGTIPEQVLKTKGSLKMLENAATNCIDKSLYNKDEIDLLIYAGVYRDEYMLEPAYAAILAGKLDMNFSQTIQEDQNLLAFDIFNSSIGFLNACYAAQQMIISGDYNTAMIVASECENNSDLSPDDLLGIRETASSIILDKDRTNEKGFSRFLFSYDLESINSYNTYCSTKEVIPRLKIEKTADPQESYIENIVSIVKKLLMQEGLDPSQIDLILAPQISSDFITRLSESMDFPREKFIDMAGDGPDFFSSSLPYALQHANEKKLVKEGSIGIVIAVGSGVQIGCAIYHF